MVFSSSIFIFIFLPIVLIVYYLLGNVFGKYISIKVQHLFLVIASLFFYSYFEISYLPIMLSSILINYSCATIMQKYKSKNGRNIVFIIGVIFNVLLLGYFKYYDFLISSINQAFRTSFSLLHILLPLGISFFTFQQLAFLVSIKNNDESVSGSFIDYILCVTFFPHLVAGPIVTYSELMPQFKDESNRFCSFENISKGLYSFVIGLFKKLVIADSLALFANNGYTLETYGFAAAWVTALSYTLQIYFDFSGYSDMAIGLGYMFNVRLPINFNSPYKSASIKEFWSRWHITLGTSLAKFIYFPLGGNRKGKLRTYINLMATFLVSGLWHGASWTFIVWGAMHGLLNVVERIFAKPISKVPHFIRVAFIFLFVNAAWVLFRAPSFSKALSVYKGMLNISSINLRQIGNIVYDGIFSYPLIINLPFIFAVLSILLIIVFTFKSSNERLKAFIPQTRSLLFTVFVFMICIIHLSRLSTFIYFNF